MKFSMDEFEVYSSYNEAALEFSRNIALESIQLTTDIQMEFGITDDDVFSDYALENIANTVANMASKAKSNIILYSKKLINMLFGWLVNFFKGGANLKQIMKNNYDKARKYLKKLNEFESKVRALNQEKEISIRDNGSCVIIGLTVIQVIKASLDDTQAGIKKLVGNEAEDATIAGGIEETFEVFLGLMATMYSSLANINISNVKELKNGLRANKWNVSNILNNAKSDSVVKYQGEVERAKDSSDKQTETAKKKYRIVDDEKAKQDKMTDDQRQAYKDADEEREDREARKKLYSANESIDWFKYVGSRISMEGDDYTGEDTFGFGKEAEERKKAEEQKLDDKAKARNERKAERKKAIITEKEWNTIKTKISLEKQMGVVEKFREEYKSKVEDTIKYMEEPSSADMSPNEAFDVLRDQLNTYIEFSKANQWNLDQYVKIAEKMRRDMDKALNSFDAENSDETVVKEMMTAVLTLGNSFASMQSGVNGIVKRLKTAMDNIFTDTMKLGSAATKIGSSV